MFNGLLIIGENITMHVATNMTFYDLRVSRHTVDVDALPKFACIYCEFSWTWEDGAGAEMMMLVTPRAL